MRRETVPVLIVGGGGAGLTASMLLSRMGVDALLVNAAPRTSELPKAHVLNQRAMEVLADCGVADEIYRVGTPPEQFSHTAMYAGFAGHDGAGRVIFKQESWGAGGMDEEWRMASPKVSSNLPQIRLEPILRARAELMSPGRVRFHHEVTHVENLDDRVIARVTNHDSSETYEVEAEILLACDGGRTIGRQVGIEWEGPRDLSRTVSFYLSADFSEFAGDPDVLLRWIWSPFSGRMVVMAPMGPLRWGADSEEWVVHLGYGIDDQRALDDAAVEADLRSDLGIGEHRLDIHTITRWTIGGVVADRFRVGRVLVAGDAAHRHPPTGALGLTSAIHDVHNVCWKIAAVCQGRAGLELLDSYEAERRPVDARNVARSLENSKGYATMAKLMRIGDKSLTFDDRWNALSRLWSNEPEDASFRRRVLELMAAQSQEFREHDVEYGYDYESGAVIPDGSASVADSDFRCYIPSTRPGSPLPHAWIEDWNQNRCSTLDLVTPGSFVLIAGEDGDDWCRAAEVVRDEIGVELNAVTIGHSRGDWRDPRLRWHRVRGFDSRGAILVRPDRCVAFRAMTMMDDPAAVLRSVVRRVLAIEA